MLLAQFVLLQHAIETIPRLSEIAKRWKHDVAWCNCVGEGGACGNRVRGLVIMRVMVGSWSCGKEKS
jgi:hypothetical protein